MQTNNSNMAKKKYDLVGIDGNAFSVMGYVRNAMREQKFGKDAIEEYTKAAMSGDYDNLLCVSMMWVDVCNAKAKGNK